MSKHFIRIYLFGIAILVWGCANQSVRQSDQHQTVDEASSLSTEQTSASKSTTLNSLQAQDSTLNAGRHNAITRAVQQVSPAVVSITVTEVVQSNRQQEMFRRFFNLPTEQEYSSVGSGFIISKDGYVVTNEHVADADAKKIMVSMMDSLQYEAEVIGTDELADLALLKIKADREFPHMKFGDSDEVIVGEWSLAIGNPFGLFKSAQPSVTVGVISALHRDFRPNPEKPRVYMDMIQTDAAINSGNSGGPLVNSDGEVIGVNTFIYTGGTSGGFVGLGFAIPSNRVRKIIDQLATTGEVKTGYDLGIETTPMTYKLAAQNNLPAIVGLFVSSVNRDGPAFEGGIIPGDIIIKIGQERVQSQMHAQALFREYDVGDTLHVHLIRKDKIYQADIKLRSKAENN